MTTNNSWTDFGFKDSKEEKSRKALVNNRGVHQVSKVNKDGFTYATFWRESADGRAWSIFGSTEHLKSRTEKRKLAQADIFESISYILDAIEETGELRYIASAGSIGKRVMINDEVNGLSYALLITPEVQEIGVLTAWKATNSAHKTNMLTVTLFRNGKKMVFVEKDQFNRESHYVRHMLEEPVPPIHDNGSDQLPTGGIV